ncbi:hypothetical protein [Bradyrhizobium sp. AUGA SZCCT0283]|uniref:hypothetical protein n=1 Tax=Bradyrhizobium sp. AUGA SZCCT0283 TaxID=2807671 RepID=UPI001BA81EA0|nr:hypothetical protein [Bradyrhizobium sp. AUGA SZCCT0283]MBR1278337.1 hypothetical protein [Bradyrhizobium sp. AUGA SZCCT0283]
MKKLDNVVAQHIEQRLLQSKRLEQILSATLHRRKERAEPERHNYNPPLAPFPDRP